MSADVPNSGDWERVRNAQQLCFVGEVAYVVADIGESRLSAPTQQPRSRIVAPETINHQAITDILSARQGDGKATSSSVVEKIRFVFSRKRKQIAFLGGITVVLAATMLTVMPRQTMGTEPQKSSQPLPAVVSQEDNWPTNTSSPEDSNLQGTTAETSPKIDGAWFISAMNSRSQAIQSDVLKQTLSWKPGDEIASRPITATGDLGIFAVCSVTKAGDALCARVVVESSQAGNSIREIIRPAT
jgi:hypothetical protein